MVADVAAYVPGYRLKQAVQFTDLDASERHPHRSTPPLEPAAPHPGQRCSSRSRAPAHYLPAYAGNLDIMTSAALRVGETLAAERPSQPAEAIR